MNIKLGFATNSSSLHSIVILPPNHNLKDQIDSFSFERYPFIASSREAKMRYLAAQLKENIEPFFGWYITKLIIKDICKIEIDDSYSVDHQSIIPIPLDDEFKGLNKDFLKDLKKFLYRRDVVIVGDDDCSDPLSKISQNYKINDSKNFFTSFFLSTKIRAKRQKKYWTFFEKETGKKITFTFEDNLPPLIKGYTPDLVDFKITNYCNHNCMYCYQNSNKKGKHADINIIDYYLQELENLNIFEVAIGGGEPTTHPFFRDILYSVNSYNMVPNFSTRSVDWLKNKEIVETVNKVVGSVGFSVNNIDDVRKILHLSNKFNLSEKKISFHYVLGTTPMHELKELYECIIRNGFQITFLGYKKVGRGTDYSPYDNEKWIELVQIYLSSSIGIDTLIAKKYKSQLDEAGVLDCMYFTEEGKFSFYLDAVTQKMGPSSYCSKKEMKSLKRKFKRFDNTILRYFREF